MISTTCVSDLGVMSLLTIGYSFGACQFQAIVVTLVSVHANEISTLIEYKKIHAKNCLAYNKDYAKLFYYCGLILGGWIFYTMYKLTRVT